MAGGGLLDRLKRYYFNSIKRPPHADSQGFLIKMSSSLTRTTLIAGASGLVGRKILSLLLADPPTRPALAVQPG